MERERRDDAWRDERDLRVRWMLELPEPLDALMRAELLRLLRRDRVMTRLLAVVRCTLAARWVFDAVTVRDVDAFF